MRHAETPITAWGIWLGLAQIATGIGCAAMPLFKVGDRVERIGVLAPTWMKEGIITRVIPNKYGIDSATEYEVEFGQLKAILYQVELRVIKSDPPHD
jgi:hypothetical protein